MCLCTLPGTSIRLQLYLSTNPQRCKENEGQKTGRKRTCGTSLERGTKNPGGITAFSTKETYVIFLAKMLKIWQFKARDREETAGRPGGALASFGENGMVKGAYGEETQKWKNMRRMVSIYPSFGTACCLTAAASDGWTAGRPYRLGREEFDRYRWEAGASLLCTILDVRAK